MAIVPDLIDTDSTVEEVLVTEKHAVVYQGEKNLETWTAPNGWLDRLKGEYSGKNEQESLPPGCDPDRFALAILTMNETEAVKTLSTILANLHNDYTFDMTQVPWIKQLVAGPEASGLEPPEWGYQVCKMAGIFHNWSAYLEVRACTLPYDDPEEPCESFRAYLVGFFWVIVNTSVNTCEYSTGLCSRQFSPLVSLVSRSLPKLPSSCVFQWDALSL